MRQLYGLTIGKHFDVDLTTRDEYRIATNKGHHPAIRRKRRLGYRIGELGQLNPLRAVERTDRAAHPKSSYKRDDGNGRRGGDNLPAF